MPSFCVRILKNGRQCGAGILLDSRHVATCAHVVNTALEAGQQLQEMPSGSVSLDFPWSRSPEPVHARVAGWHPPAPFGTAPAGLADIAVLRLDEEVADRPAELDLSISQWGGQSFYTVGFTTSARNGIAVTGRTEGMLPGNRIEVAAAGPFGGTIEPGFSGAPVSFNAPLESGSVAGMVFAHGPQDSRTAQLIPAYRVYHAWLLARNPYKGLARFERDDAGLFFGRDDEIEDFMDLRADKKVTIIVGPAGSGKSSLVFGGLLPEIARRTNVRVLRVVRFRPGRAPMDSLRAALAEVTDPAFPTRWLDQIAANPARIVDAAKWLATEGKIRLLLVGDQMEEAFTLSDRDRAQSQNFFKAVKAIYGDPDESASFLGTLSAEFLANALRDRDLSALGDSNFFLLRAIAPENLSKVIRGPAGRLGVSFEHTLEDRLETQARDVANPLPLMELALQRLWRRIEWCPSSQTDRRWTIPLSAYESESLGEELAKHADGIVAKLDPDKATARRLLCSLVNFEDSKIESWGRHPRTRDELGKLGAGLWDMAERLARTGDPEGADHRGALVEIGRDSEGKEVADLVHECLISSWPQLAGWVGEANEHHASLNVVRNRMREPNRVLTAGYDLERARRLLEQDFVQIDPVVHDYIQRSRAYREEEARRDDMRRRELALTKREDVTRASRELLRAEEEAKDLCGAVRRELGFAYAAVQLLDKADRTISTIYGEGQESDWFGIASHNMDVKEESLRDIQVHVASLPPKIEVIAGRDDRFDKFIFTKFHHERHARVFAPILLSTAREPELERQDGDAEPLSGPAQRPREPLPPDLLGCDLVLDDDKSRIADPQPTDGRRAYRPAIGAEGRDIIGTIEAGFECTDAKDARRRLDKIDENTLRSLLQICHGFAPRLRRTSLHHVFETIVKTAMTVMNPDAAYLGFAYNENREQFEYEATAYAKNPLLIDKLRLGARRRDNEPIPAVLVPYEGEGRRKVSYEKEYPEAYAAGIRAEAIVPIVVSDDRQPEQRQHGVLQLVYTRPEPRTPGADHVGEPYPQSRSAFYPYDEAYLASLASRAEEAIRLATAIARSRVSARGLRNLHHIANALAESRSEANLLREVAGYAMNMFSADLVTVYEYQEPQGVVTNSQTVAGTYLETVGLAGQFKTPEQTAPRVLSHDSAPFNLLRIGKNQYDNQLHEAVPCGPDRPASFVVREGIEWVVGVILRTRTEIVGTMFLNYRTKHFLSAEKRDLADALASTAAIAIRNRRIIAAARRPGGGAP